jgi:hypothetical protein
MRTSSKGTNPHQPAVKAENEPTAHAPTTLDGEELGAKGEEQVAAEDRTAAAIHAVREANTGSSSSSPPADPSPKPKQAKPSQTTSKTKPNQAKTNPKPSQTKPSQTKPPPSQTKPSQTKPSRTTCTK